MTKKTSTQSAPSVALEQAGQGAIAGVDSGRRDSWQRRLQELAAFKKRFGHCDVSTLSKNHASLGNWVRTQRGRRRQGHLSKERIRLLDELGFSSGSAYSTRQGENTATLADAWQAGWEAKYASWRPITRRTAIAGCPSQAGMMPLLPTGLSPSTGQSPGETRHAGRFGGSMSLDFPGTAATFWIGPGGSRSTRSWHAWHERKGIAGSPTAKSTHASSSGSSGNGLPGARGN